MTRSKGGRFEGMRRRHALVAPCLWVAVACGADTDGTDPGDTRELGGAAALQRADPWWCLGLAPPLPSVRTAHPVVAFVLPVVDWATRQPLAGRGLVASLCAATPFDCANPLAPPYVVRDGRLGEIAIPSPVAGIAVPQGFDGMVRLHVARTATAEPSDAFLPVHYFLNAPVMGDVTLGQPVLMTTRANWETLVLQSFPTHDASALVGAGTVMAGAFDCNGEPAPDVRVEMRLSGEPPGDVVAFSLPASRIPIEQPSGEPPLTGASGAVGYLGVPPGAVELRAFRAGDAQAFATAQLGSVAGSVSIATLQPPYRVDAQLIVSLDEVQR